jgi:signal transduction histidine kinase
LVVSNTGDAMPLRADRVFNRFQRQARAEGNQDSTGLGLAIVKNICALYRFRIEYTYSDSWHSFHIHFDPAEVEIPISYRIEY